MPLKKIQINPYLYIPFVLGLTWLPWFLAISTGRGVENLAVKVLLLAGLLIPALVAIVFCFWARSLKKTGITGVGSLILR